jgi:hypothetical protein
MSKDIGVSIEPCEWPSAAASPNGLLGAGPPAAPALDWGRLRRQGDGLTLAANSRSHAEAPGDRPGDKTVVPWPAARVTAQDEQRPCASDRGSRSFVARSGSLLGRAGACGSECSNHARGALTPQTSGGSKGAPLTRTDPSGLAERRLVLVRAAPVPRTCSWRDELARSRALAPLCDNCRKIPFGPLIATRVTCGAIHSSRGR